MSAESSQSSLELHKQENQENTMLLQARTRKGNQENTTMVQLRTRKENQENTTMVQLRTRKETQENQENRENVAPRPATRTVLGALLHNRQSSQQGAGSKQLSCKNEDFSNSCVEKVSKPAVFKVHVDEPDSAACAKKPALQAVPAVKARPAEGSAAALHSAMTRLRQPLAPLDIPSAMDVSFDSPMDMSLVEGEEKLVDVHEVLDYAEEIHAYLREMEVKTRPKAGYMKKQPDITTSMRAILVDWLVEVGEEYKLQNETLYLAVNYIDRFLSSMSVLRGKLQLVGTAAMLLASKFEEIYPPEVAEFVYITDDTYTKKQVLRMEHLVLKVLSFDLAAPTINQFLAQYLLHHSAGKRYLAELSLVDCEPFLKYLPSHTAAAALLDLHDMFLAAGQHAQQSVQDKYKSSKYQEVSLIAPPTKLQLN
ncbi:hypothetical protein CRUP_020992 [Coryphaenoides rupestris]|nr:hypothetical protein CRUP_020992 [Coryphaenoides rupestris]